MRIVAGKFRGHPLTFDPKATLRPTSDRLREAVFNILEHRHPGIIQDEAIMDIFAGTGAYGFEAISRGARLACFVEQSATQRGMIWETAENLGILQICNILRRDGRRLGQCRDSTPYGLAFIDPPYNKGMAEQALKSAAAGKWLAAGALVVVEEGADAALKPVEHFEIWDRREIGKSVVYFLRYLVEDNN